MADTVTLTDDEMDTSFATAERTSVRDGDAADALEASAVTDGDAADAVAARLVTDGDAADQ